MSSLYRSVSSGQQPGQPVERGAFTPAEAAVWLSISLSQLYSLTKSGEIRARRCGARILISRKALEEYLEASEAS